MNKKLEKAIEKAVIDSGLKVKEITEEGALVEGNEDKIWKFQRMIGNESVVGDSENVYGLVCSVPDSDEEYFYIPVTWLDNNQYLIGIPEQAVAMLEVVTQEEAAEKDPNSVMIDDYEDFLKEVKDKYDPKYPGCLICLDGDATAWFAKSTIDNLPYTVHTVVGWDDAMEETDYEIENKVYGIDGKKYAPEERLVKGIYC